MKEPYAHAVMPRANHDELAREQFVAQLRHNLDKDINPGDRTVYDLRVKPKLAKQGATASHRHIRKEMEAQPYVQMWSALQKTWKEMQWDCVAESVDRQLPELVAKSRAVKKPRGSLTLDAALPIPRYLSAVDIHWMPGNYHTEHVADDVFAGALYDRGGYYVSVARLGALAHRIEEKPDNFQRSFPAHNTIRFIRERFPDFQPKRILDLGCTIGMSTAPFAEAWPDAEVHGIDVGAPLLRYGHARAESLGTPIHLSQQNAEHTNFETGSFDLVVSHNLFHETSTSAAQAILVECHRLLRPGGITLHAERKFFQGLDPYEAYANDWDTFYDNEPFKGTLRAMNPAALMVKAGFDKDKVIFVGAAKNIGGGSLFTEPADPRAYGNVFGAVR